jgi:asparagine synthase (glutamine-hydrolysing)
MCGITGFYDSKASQTDLDSQALTMANQLESRGPDDFGVWSDSKSGLAFAHRRLSVLDLSVAGHQPMISHSGRFVLTFNGEIYNHIELRSKLTKIYSWKGLSDTETILACIEEWGLDETLKNIVGMFAFALWDSENMDLYLVRDRIGEKPLYYGWQNEVFLFGSDLNSLSIHQSFENIIDRDALALYLRHSYIPAPYSIYQGIGKVVPGTIVKLSMNNILSKTLVDLKVSNYWSYRDTVLNGQINPIIGTDDNAINDLENLLMSATKSQMLSDVPLGAFLSGGVDSSAVVALMQKQSVRPIQTFSIGFSDTQYNEAKYAKLVAKHLKTEHNELYISHKDAMEVIPLLPSLYSEPFSDSSQIPTYLVSKLAKKNVTVAISGDGGDELFGGYNRYMWTSKVHNKTKKIPKVLSRFIANRILSIPPRNSEKFLNSIFNYLPNSFRVTHSGDKLHKLAGILTADSKNEIYNRLTSHWCIPTSVVKGSVEPITILTSNDIPHFSSFEEQMMYLDMLSYLPDDILTKVDRAAMGVSLETRVPFLDHRVVEFAARLPLSMKIRNGTGKWILRQVLERHVPNKLIDRPKMGFSIPIDEWLRGPLRDWAEELLDEVRLESEGFFYPKPILKMWHEHLLKKRNWQHELWDILMFQAWLQGRKCSSKKTLNEKNLY